MRLPWQKEDEEKVNLITMYYEDETHPTQATDNPSHPWVEPEALALSHLLQEPDKISEDPQAFLKEMKEISILIRTARGEPLENESAITQLTDVKNLMERSRFPTYPILGKQVYLRLMADFIPEAKVAFEWAEKEAHAFIGYKGQARTESVEMNKSQGQQPAQQFYLGGERKQEASVEQPKRHFWSRGPKKEQDELEGQQ